MRHWLRWSSGAGSVVALLLAHALSEATPVTITDTYGQGSPDVIGAPADFDIEKIVFTSLSSSHITAEIYFNSSHSPATGAYSYAGVPGLTLAPGDLLFDVGGTYKYGAAVTSHNGLTAGDVYTIGSLYTAFDLINPQGIGASYRPSEYVQIKTGTLDATGTINVASLTSPEYKVTLDFAPSAAFWNDVLTAPDGMSVHFAAATCANDIIDGHIPTPEPGTLLLLGTGLVAAGAAARRRFARQ